MSSRAPSTSGFCGVVLAGGQSSRMGSDKARLPLPGGQSLLEHTVQTLRACGAEPVFVSVRPGQSYRLPGVGELRDRVLDAGPLGGIAAALEAAPGHRLLVLAVDMPAMSPGFLINLARAGGSARGAIPMRDGRYEPLAAVYPKNALSLAWSALRAGRLSLQSWAGDLVQRGFAVPYPIPAVEARFFANWNTPADAALSR